MNRESAVSAAPTARRDRSRVTDRATVDAADGNEREAKEAPSDQRAILDIVTR